MSQKGVPALPPIPATPHILTGAKRVVFCYDIICPYAYIASKLIEDVGHEYHAKVEFYPVLLSGLITQDLASRVSEQPQPDVPAAKKAYGRQNLIREAARHGVELHIPAHHPVRSVAAMQLLAALEGAERVALTHHLFKAYWVEGRDISNESVLMESITVCGIKAARINREHGKEVLIEHTQHAYDQGAFGVPTFLVHNLEHGHDGTMFFGVDRLMFVHAALGDESDQHLLFRVTTDPAPLTPLPTVEFFFDITSPWSFLGFTQLRKFSHLCSLTLTPIVVGGLFKQLHTTPPQDSHGRNKARFYSTDLQDWAAWWQEPVVIPPFFPVRGIVPNRLVLAHPPCAEALFRALWQHGRNVGEAAEAVAVLDEAGFKGQQLLAKAESSEVKAQLLDNTKRAEALGVFGVPSYLVQGSTLIFGQDHIDTLLDVLSGWTPPTSATPTSSSTSAPFSLPAKL